MDEASLDKNQDLGSRGLFKQRCLEKHLVKKKKYRLTNNVTYEVLNGLGGYGTIVGSVAGLNRGVFRASECDMRALVPSNKVSKAGEREQVAAFAACAGRWDSGRLLYDSRGGEEVRWASFHNMILELNASDDRGINVVLSIDPDFAKARRASRLAYAAFAAFPALAIVLGSFMGTDDSKSRARFGSALGFELALRQGHPTKYNTNHWDLKRFNHNRQLGDGATDPGSHYYETELYKLATLVNHFEGSTDISLYTRVTNSILITHLHILFTCHIFNIFVVTLTHDYLAPGSSHLGMHLEERYSFMYAAVRGFEGRSRGEKKRLRLKVGGDGVGKVLFEEEDGFLAVSLAQKPLSGSTLSRLSKFWIECEKIEVGESLISKPSETERKSYVGSFASEGIRRKILDPYLHSSTTKVYLFDLKTGNYFRENI
ncbi:hypothetical protein Syun_014696 [Stephania yunnanensis]|uniref:Uncharacterized protein n=1 Tax=Stephania yunnanensis TaxID=152371 RepID=A0AAP0JJT6_9MAGN